MRAAERGIGDFVLRRQRSQVRILSGAPDFNDLADGTRHDLLSRKHHGSGRREEIGRFVVDDPDLMELFEAWWSTPALDAIARMKLYKLGWDLTGSEFAGRHSLYEKFYAG